MADAEDSKSSGVTPVGVRPPLPAPVFYCRRNIRRETAARIRSVKRWILNSAKR